MSFGPDGSSMYLCRMAEIAEDAQNNVPRDPLAPPAATVKSTYTQALDTVRSFRVHVDKSLDIILGTTRRNVPWNCGVASEATGCTDALNLSLQTASISH